MIKEIATLNNLVFNPLDLQISDIIPDLECEDYFGFNFKINQINIKFRKSKLTPKKVGQFVTFWKRDSDGKTIPFDISGDFDYYIIYVEENENSGSFIFPKAILEKENYISGKLSAGKRGFRIYADWHLPNNKKAEKTKYWQTEFFINFSEPENIVIEKFKNIFNYKTQ